MSNLFRSDHADHDPLLVAALADRELTGEEHDRARAQVAACTDCASLHADLVSIARATHALPPIARSRDFTLRPEDAQRYRPGLVRRLVGAFGTARDGFSRPLAMGLTTLGLAGLLIGIVPGALSSGGTTSLLAPVGTPVEDVRLESLSAAPRASSERDTANGLAGDATGAPAVGQEAGSDPGIEAYSNDASGEGDPAGLAPDSSGMSLMIVLSGSFLIAGLGLFALRWTTSRFGG
jgi:anti-sigma factor RsiW